MQEMRAQTSVHLGLQIRGQMNTVWGTRFLHHGTVLGQPKRKIASLEPPS